MTAQKSVVTFDIELDALETTTKHLMALLPAERQRVLGYLLARFEGDRPDQQAAATRATEQQ